MCSTAVRADCSGSIHGIRPAPEFTRRAQKVLPSDPSISAAIGNEHRSGHGFNKSQEQLKVEQLKVEQLKVEQLRVIDQLATPRKVVAGSGVGQ
ncbi:MAG TPA: hypothetical protein VL068_03515 [Microthrixaceae bacterium]|nr:hypothetical protein [Microthrixaceae bacterium]